MHNGKTTIHLLLASAFAFVPMTVHAQAGPASPLVLLAAADAVADTADDTGGEIIVTAERRETSLQKTPIAISVFTGQTLTDRNIRDVRDLAGQVPNLFVPRVTISHTTQTFALRGIGESDPIQEPVLAVYVDDVYIPRQIGSMVEFNDLERIEVLRGPQGTLYGRNSSAGALRIITRDPGQDTRISAELGYGSKNEIDARALLSGPLSDTLSASISYIHHSRDGVTQDPTLGHDVNRIDVDALRAKLHWTPSDKLDVLATVNVVRDRSDSRSYIPVNQPGVVFDKRVSYSEVEPLQDLDGRSAALRVKYDLNSKLSLKSISAISGFNLKPVSYDNDGQSALIQKNLIHYRDSSETQEFQLNGDYGALTFTGGLFYLHERFFVQRDGFTRLGTSPTAAINSQRAHNTTTTDAYAIFGEATYRFSDIFSLTGGLRGTIERKKFVFDNKVLNLQREVIAQSIAGEASKTSRALTPKASVQAQWTPSLLQYASYSRGFKSGGFDNRATRLDLATLPFAPEKVGTYETGLKATLFDKALRVNIAAFYNNYKDLQVSFFDPVYAGTRRGNAGKAHSWGVEVETSASLTDHLTAQLAGGYLKAIYDDYKGAGGKGIDADGNDLINAPHWSLSGGLAYDIGLGKKGGLRLATDAQYQSSIYSSPLNRPQDKSPGQAFVNGTITYTTPDPRYQVILSGRNLFDSDKPVSASYTPSIGAYYQNFPDGRTFLVSVKFSQ